MPEFLRYTLVAIILFLAHLQEGITGFGCAVLSIPFLAMLLGLDVAVQMMMMLGWCSSLLIVLDSRKHIVWKEFARITTLVGLGLPFGILAAKSVPQSTLKWVLAGFMVAVGAQGLVVQFGNKPVPKMTPRTRLLTSLFLPLGGVIHGVFGTGGPLIVIYAARAITDKTLFRVTLSMMWFVMASLMTGHWIADSSLKPGVLGLVACCVPITITAIHLGNKAHYRVNDLAFRKVVYSVLIASGGALVWSLTHSAAS